MALSVDKRRVVRAWVVPWESEAGLYGVAYELGEGKYGADFIGTKSQAEQIVSDIATQRVVAFQAVSDHDG